MAAKKKPLDIPDSSIPKLFYHFYEAFRKRNPNPANHNDKDIECYASFVFDGPDVAKTSDKTIEMVFTFSPSDTDRQLESYLKSFRKQVMAHPAREYDSFAWMKDTDWLGSNGKFRALENILKVYDLYLQHKNKSKVSDIMGWFNKEQRTDCIKEISRYLKHADRFIEAAGRGTLSFAVEVKKPIR